MNNSTNHISLYWCRPGKCGSSVIHLALSPSPMGAMQWRVQSLPPSLSVDMPHAIFMTGQGGGEGGAWKESEGERGSPADRQMVSLVVRCTNVEPTLPRSLTPIDRNVENCIQVFDNGNESTFVEAISFPLDAQKMDFGADLILMSQAKSSVLNFFTS